MYKKIDIDIYSYENKFSNSIIRRKRFFFFFSLIARPLEFRKVEQLVGALRQDYLNSRSGTAKKFEFG